jgi:hypothetical protein
VGWQRESESEFPSVANRGARSEVNGVSNIRLAGWKVFLLISRFRNPRAFSSKFLKAMSL